MKKKVMHFHVGRGGQFNNPGHKTFVGIEPMHFHEYDTIIQEDEDGNPLPDDEWILHDGTGEILLTGKDSIMADTGVLNYDGAYNTDIYKYLDECDEDELWLIAEDIERTLQLTEDEKRYVLKYGNHLPCEE